MGITIKKYPIIIAKGTTINQLVENFIEEVKTEEVIGENGLFNVATHDIEDEKQFLHSDIAEDIDEEDQDIGVSDEMKGVYK